MKIKHFNLFILLMMSLSTSLSIANAYPDSNITLVKVANAHTSNVLINTSDGISDSIVNSTNRLGRINFNEFTDISRDLHNSVDNSSNMELNLGFDYDLEGNEHLSYSLSSQDRDIWDIDFDSSIYANEGHSFSSVVLFDDINYGSRGIEIVVEFDGTTDNHGIGFYNDSGGYHLWCATDGYASNQYFHLGSYQPDLSIPFYFGARFDNDYTDIYYGNVNSLSNIYNHQFDHTNDSVDNELDSWYFHLNFGGKLIVLDWDFACNWDTLSYGFDEDLTYYQYRSLYFYQTLDKSYGLNDYDDFSILDLDNVDNFEVSDSYYPILTNLTDNQDYKLNDDFSNKSGVIQWGNGFNNWVNNSATNCNILEVDFLDRDNVMQLEDSNNAGSCDIDNYLITNGINATIEFFISKDSISPSASTINFIFLDNIDKVSAQFRLESDDLDSYYGATFNAIWNSWTNPNQFYHFSIVLNDFTKTYGIYIDGKAISLSIPYRDAIANGISRIRLLSDAGDTLNTYIDCIGISTEGYIMGSNKYIGSQDYTKYVNTIELYNNTGYGITRMRIFDATWVNITGKTWWINQNWESVYTTNETDNSSIAVIFSEPIDSGIFYLRLKLETIAYSEDSAESSIGIYMNTNTGAWQIHPDIYDLDSGTYTEYFHSSGTFTHEFNKDERYSLIVQRDRDVGFTINFFNQTDMLLERYISEGITFAINTTLEFQNYYSLGSPNNCSGIKIYGVIGNNNDSGNYTFEKYRDLLIDIPKMYSVSYSDYITISAPILSFEFQAPYVYQIYSKYIPVDLFQFKESLHNINVSLSSTKTRNINSTKIRNYIFFEESSIEFVCSESEFLDKTIINDYVARLLVSEHYTLEIKNTIYVYWNIYVSNNPTTIVDQLMSVGTQLLILGIFPYTFYKVWDKKGAIIGFIVGFLILTFSGLLSLTYAVILVPLSLIVSYYTIFKKGGNSNDL